jgi:tripartite-type tricarboxylate transporter receptor subunit TctC
MIGYPNILADDRLSGRRAQGARLLTPRKNMQVHRSCVHTAALLALAAIACPTWAQYPERLIRAIVPFAAGGSNDTMARLIAPELTKALGQQVIVENRPGAAGNIGIDAVAKSAPNGHTILFSATASTQNPALFRKLPFDPLRDIQPVAEIGQAPYVFLVNPSVPARNIQELIQIARKSPGKLNAASGGIGTRLASELFRIQNRLKLEIIPYQGSGQAALAVMTGETDFVVMETSPVQGQVAAGKLRALAVAGEKRLKPFPNLPTTAEAGFPEYKAGTIFGVYVAAGTPGDIVQKLNATLNRIIGTPAVAARLLDLGVESNPKSVEEFSTLYRKEIEKWKDIVKKANIPPVD